MPRKLLVMQDPEAYLRSMAAPLAWVQEGSPPPVTRFSLEAVANAFVMLGLLPGQRAEEILAAQRTLLEAAGFRVGLSIGELSVSPAGVQLIGVRRTPTGTQALVRTQEASLLGGDVLVEAPTLEEIAVHAAARVAWRDPHPGTGGSPGRDAGPHDTRPSMSAEEVA